MKYLIVFLFVFMAGVTEGSNTPTYRQNITMILSTSEVDNVFQTDVKGEIQCYENHFVFVPKKNPSDSLTVNYSDVEFIKKATFVVVPNHLHIKLKNGRLIKFFTYKRHKLYELIQSKITNS